MARSAAVLAVYLLSASGDRVRAGSLVRDGSGAVTFVVDDHYLRTPGRPILSLAWVDRRGERETQARLTNRSDKIAYPGFLPPWFSGLLPEGALRDLVEREMGPGDHDYFDVLARLGADLAGAVVIVPETGMGADLGAIGWGEVAGVRAPVPEGVVKFSLAGVQLKFNVVDQGDRLTMPGRSGEGRIILKAPSAAYQGLPEAEYAAMTLCRAAGINTATVRLIPVAAIEGIPEVFLEAGEYALAVDRFDRTGGGRVHIEDAAQILGAVGDRKYTMANTDTVLNMIRRFSVNRRNDVLEGLRRVAADILIGNGDNHLKNWSFRFEDGVSPKLSPANDIVPTVLYSARDNLALEFVGSKTFETIGLAKFRRLAAFLDVDADRAEGEIRKVVQRALDQWPGLLQDLPLPSENADTLLARLQTLQLVQEVQG
ncbi:MAG: type II toxin-antitoxin system HipA family toxin [Phenylobacterium sp.]|uniref:type II toxin-antitoxin system HipA family toxin n=1 Tax=Phenylobacterium sp. TaxID=1871053 RepID=UPI002733A10D|nr:type II toxin-antitoxin system HipA family toxin [Phenylobacterium sp.]MDP1643864.1 type II toxin-antitoxin system HipA family toxin [Phenylobacterium sp.]MDP3116130.1 type II toxin-antitoxin system HipA family toxin [Phenylobacterium sp.]